MDVSAISSIEDDDITPAVVIKDIARQQLVELGAAALSLDTVARAGGFPSPMSKPSSRTATLC